jgi:hypothetical protein
MTYANVYNIRVHYTRSPLALKASGIRGLHGSSRNWLSLEPRDPYLNGRLEGFCKDPAWSLVGDWMVFEYDFAFTLN